MNPTSPHALRGAFDLSSLKNTPSDQRGTNVSAVMDVTDAQLQSVLELSATVPVILEMWDESGAPTADLEALVRQLSGRVALGRVAAESNPQTAQAFQAQPFPGQAGGEQATPIAIAFLGGQPVPLFRGVIAAEQIRDLLGQLLQLAAQHGITGVLPVEDQPGGDEQPELPPLHAEAYSAIELGNFDGAIAAYEKALQQNPRDTDAQSGLAQVQLLVRVQGVDLQAARQQAADNDMDIAAQLTVADLDVSGGHVEDAFARLLELFQNVDQDQKGMVRDRLLELFAAVGTADPRVAKARSQLTSLMF